jgi:ssDNA-binding Zn-finger/Zn-ribbon topoisomerase 1
LSPIVVYGRIIFSIVEYISLGRGFMFDKKCSKCGREYYLNHSKLPYKDEGETLFCKCGEELFRYGKGTDSYGLILVEDYKKQVKQREEEEKNHPICDCGLKMTPRRGPYGNFFGCSRYPKGCKKKVKI